MNQHFRIGSLLWWSVRRAVRAYGVLRATAAPVALAMAWLLFSVSSHHGGESRNPWPVYGGIGALVVVAACFALWRIITDKASGFTEGLAWHGESAKRSTLCTAGAHMFLFGLQAALLIGLARLLYKWIGS